MNMMQNPPQDDEDDQADEAPASGNGVVDNIEQGDPTNDENGMDQDTVETIAARIEGAMPDIKTMAQFENALEQQPQIAQMLAQLCPELIQAFVNVAQERMQGGGENQAPNPPGNNDGATVPSGPPDAHAPDQQDEGGMLMPDSAANGPLPPPAATSTGQPPPSMPERSGLRRQFFTGR